MQLVGRDQKLAETSTTIIYDAYLVSRWWWQCNPHHANFTKKSLIVHFLIVTSDLTPDLISDLILNLILDLFPDLIYIWCLDGG